MLLETIKIIEEKVKHRLSIKIIPNNIDLRTNFCRKMIETLKEDFPTNCFNSFISSCTALREAANLGKPIIDYDKQCKKSKEGNYTVPCFFEIPFRAIGYGKENDHYVCDLELSVEVQNMESRGTYRGQKDIREDFSLEKLKTVIKEGSSLTEIVIVPLEKGTNKIYFSVRDKIQQRRLRKLDILKIK